jgi:hypothetical protein
MKFEYPFGATPLDGDEAALLIPKHITVMSELNAFEHVNILMAEQWALRSRFDLTVSYRGCIQESPKSATRQLLN